MSTHPNVVPPRPLRALGGVLVLVGTLLAPAREAVAGCGCQKPAPPPAAVRPTVTYAGADVTLFGKFTVGASYTVTFTSGTTGASATASATAVSRRDLSDGVARPQLNVTVPTLPLGPTKISVTGPTAGGVLLSIPDTDFTVAPQPVALPIVYGNYYWPNYRAAVGRSGVVYVSLDLTGMTQPLVFEADFQGYPLRFTNQDVIFRNVQGFLMQTLVQSSPTGTAPIPGMFVQPAATPSTASDRLHYSRHEFNTYFLQHQERLPHAVDPTDGNWHLDGTPHIDHDHLIVALSARRNDGTLPPPGATPAFNLRLTAYSLFYQGVVGTSSVVMDNNAVLSSYDPATGATGSQGSVFTNGTLTMKAKSRIEGDATAAKFTLASGNAITGLRTTGSTMTYMPVQVPVGIPNLGAISLLKGSRTIVGPGSFAVSSILLKSDAILLIDNRSGPVTLYVTGSVGLENTSRIDVLDPDPERFAIYVAGTSPVTMQDSGVFVGVIYAPTSPISMKGGTLFAGAFLGKTMSITQNAWIHYDQALRGN